MLSAHPGARAPFWLASVADVPMQQRPVFLVKFMTREEYMRYDDTFRRAVDAANDEEFFNLLYEAIFIGVTGWKNVNDAKGNPRPFTREEMDKPDAGLTNDELWGLAKNYTSAVTMRRLDRKNFESPAVTSTGASAGEAKTDAASPPAST